MKCTPSHLFCFEQAKEDIGSSKLHTNPEERRDYDIIRYELPNKDAFEIEEIETRDAAKYKISLHKGGDIINFWYVTSAMIGM